MTHRSSFDTVEFLLKRYVISDCLYSSDISEHDRGFLMNAVRKGYLRKVGKRDYEKGQKWLINFHGVWIPKFAKAIIKDIRLKRLAEEIAKEEAEVKNYGQSTKAQAAVKEAGL